MEARPDNLKGKTVKAETGYGTCYITVNELDGQPFEVFVTIGKSGGALMAKGEAIGRLVSLALRNGIPVSEVIDQIEDISDDKPLPVGTDLVKSIPDAVGKTLRKLYGGNNADRK